ncbi:flavin reductase [Sphingomonas sp. AP4-R1]|uniref:flavin reductase family protein n=1 Tax=Sphingomonas sp. AP4-R1 TaxID=2735134 RepID=UPI001493ACE2|nr:flavin reductase family protein [Sphingomonas sp. AP4-R1]QJU58796.1 flavin reductase [Sphingomonas sp. AP4-R1]
MSETRFADTAAELSNGLKSAMRRMPGAVALITTRDPATDQPAGLAASAVIPVSMEPPSMLVAINRASSAHSAIERAQRYCVNLLGTTHTAFVSLFSNSAMREQRFASDEWRYQDGIPYLPSACSSIFCEIRTTLVHGTHELFIGDVYDVRSAGGDGEPADPLGWLEGTFAQLGRLPI